MPLIDVNAELDIPLLPPAGWFEAPTPDEFDPRDGLIQIDLSADQPGKVVALVAPEGENVLRGDIDWQTPQSPTNYEYAHVGTTMLEDGSTIRTGNIGGSINHAGRYAGLREAMDLYANTASRTMRGRYHDVPGIGIVFTGALYPGHSVADAITIMGMAISGDWRWVESLQAQDFAGSQLVLVPALRPLPHGVKRHPKHKPLNFLPVAASFGQDQAVFGAWGNEDDDIVERLASLITAAAQLIANSVEETPFPETTIAAAPDIDDIEFPHWDDDHDDIDDIEFPDWDDEDDDYDETDPVIAALFDGHYRCHNCAGPTCRQCGGTGMRAETPEDIHGFVITDPEDLD